MLRALEKYDVNVIGLTLSKNQADYVEQLLAASDSTRSTQVLLAGWEQHFGAYYGWAKASHLNQVVTEQKQRVLDEGWADAQ